MTDASQVDSEQPTRMLCLDYLATEVGRREQFARTFADFTRAMQQEYQEHDPIVQIAAHYHLAAMHPFLDGNGRTARALEALMLQRIGLRETSFIAMSNYYYHEQAQYLSTLAEVRRSGHDLTAFLSFALEGVTRQCQRLLTFRPEGVVFESGSEPYSHLKTPKKRVIAERQLEIIRVRSAARRRRRDP